LREVSQNLANRTHGSVSAVGFDSDEAGSTALRGVKPGGRRAAFRVTLRQPPETKGEVMASRTDRGSGVGISLGGIIVIVGIVLMIVWNFWIGLIVALIGLIAFGGFAKGKWY
jgi:hypothetical protein